MARHGLGDGNPAVTVGARQRPPGRQQRLGQRAQGGELRCAQPRRSSDRRARLDGVTTGERPADERDEHEAAVDEEVE